MSRTIGRGERSDGDEEVEEVAAAGHGESGAFVSALLRSAESGVTGVSRLVGVTLPSGKLRLEGETAFGDEEEGRLASIFTARTMGGETGVFGTVSFRLGLRDESGPLPLGVGGEVADEGVDADDIGIGGDAASSCGAALGRLGGLGGGSAFGGGDAPSLMSIAPHSALEW